MRKTTLLLFLALTLSVHAQSNQGKVSVKQSAEIDELVYGKKQQTTEKTKEQIKAEKKAAKKAEKEARKRAKEEEKRQKEAAKKGQSVTQQTKVVPEPVVVEMPKLPEQKVAQKQEVDKTDIYTGPRTKLVRRKVPVLHRQPKSVVYKGMKKTSGYRVQVFLGGNTREDRQQAERAGHKVKASFPTQPVYTHFQSPQWYCRVGNFVEYKKADAFRQKLKQLGFPNAAVIKCMITVRDVEKYNY